MTVIKIKNSAVPGKEPAAGDLDTAELALNLADRKLYSKDANGNVFELGNTNISNGGTGDKPSNPEVGDLYFDTDLELLLVWNGTDWEEVALSGESLWVEENGTLYPRTLTNAVQVGGTSADPKISLNASGSATFAGKVTTASTEDTDPGDTVVTKDYLEGAGIDGTGTLGYWDRTGTTLSPVNDEDDVEIGSGKIKLEAANGTATFNGATTNPQPLVKIKNKTGFTSAGLGVYQEGVSDPKILLNSAGSAEFSSNVFIGGTLPFNGTVPSAVPEISLYANGSAEFAGTVTAVVVPPSDQKFKENITPANPQLADVVALGNQLKNFDWNADAPVNDEIRSQRQLGLIAQEAEKICPSLVKTIKRTKQGAELTPEVTADDGTVTPATYEQLDDSYKGISHDALIMKLLGAVAELQAEVQALKGGA